MLRALDLAVASHGLSHAEVERRLCGWIAAGQKAEEALDHPGREDRDRLQALVNRKAAVVKSGLARMDGRRDRAGGQRIGELVSGKFPAGAMPPRRRVEVCVDVFLEILEENDPSGYAKGLYGTQETWRDWWLQADQGHQPEIDDRSLTVWGYLDEALKQLPTPTNQAADHNAGDQRHVTGTVNGPGVLDQTRAEMQAHAEIERRVAEANTERDQALQRARQAEELLNLARAEAQAQAQAQAQAHAEIERQVAEANTERDQALQRARQAGRRLRGVSVVAAAAMVVISVGGISRLVSADSPTHTVAFASPAQQTTTAAQRVVFSFLPTLPAGKDWTARITLNVAPTDEVSACTFGMQITAHIEVDGQALPAFTSRSGQTTINQVIHLGKRGSRGLRLIVTRLDTDPECTLRLDPAGSQATATG